MHYQCMSRALHPIDSEAILRRALVVVGAVTGFAALFLIGRAGIAEEPLSALGLPLTPAPWLTAVMGGLAGWLLARIIHPVAAPLQPVRIQRDRRRPT